MDLAKDTFTTANPKLGAEGRTHPRPAKVRAAGERIAQCATYAEGAGFAGAVRPAQAAQVKSVMDGLSEMTDATGRYNAGGALTGFLPGLNRWTCSRGWQPGNLIVLAGETSMGKSAFALQSAPLQLRLMRRNAGSACCISRWR